MTREVRHSSRVNTKLLDQGLAASSSAGEMYIRQGEAIADRVAAEGRGIESIGVARRNFQTAFGEGLKIGLIATGIGLAAMLSMFGASFVIDAWRRPYSTAAFEAISKENAALLERVEKLGELVAKPPPTLVAADPEPAQAEEPAAAADQDTIGVATAALPLDPNSTNCPENRSYTVQCSGSHQYEDGRSYTGQWHNGLPDGEGKFTMANGSVLDATWKAGFPVTVKDQPNGRKVLKTVTVFKTIQDYDLPNRILSIVAGHLFADGTSKDWETAYCYADISNKDGLLSTVYLSRYDSRTGPLIRKPYTVVPALPITAAKFKRAQDDCPYQMTGFVD